MANDKKTNDRTTTKLSKERAAAERVLPDEMLVFHDESDGELLIIDDQQCLDADDVVGVYKLVAIQRAIITLEPVK